MALPRTPVLVDDVLEARLAEDGYVVVPVLGASEVDELVRAHEAVAGGRVGDGNAEIDYTRDDRGPMAATANLVDRLVWPRLARWFAGHEPAFATFVVKPPDPRSEMFLHDDRTWVDDGAITCTAWIPLVDANPLLDNGPLFVVPRSHRIPVGASGTGTPRWCEAHERFLRGHAVGLSVRAGEAVVYDSRLLHFSPANRSDATRPAVVVTAVPAGAQLVHVVAGCQGRRIVYAVDRSFFVEVHPSNAAAVLADRYAVRRTYVERHAVPTRAMVVAMVGDEMSPR